MHYRPRLCVHSLCLFLLTCCLSIPLLAQSNAPETTVFYNAKVFTTEPHDPYAEAVAVRGEKILAVGNLSEVTKAAGASAKRVDLGGKTLFPGFIDSHSHSMMGGMGLISADGSEKLHQLDDLAPFAEEAKKSGKGMRGEILEILGIPLEFWSHTDVLNAAFSRGEYKKQCVLLRGMDGHTAWANRALLQRAGITSDYLSGLTADERSYYGVGKDGELNGFLVDAGLAKIEPLLPPPTDERLLAAGRAALRYNYSLGITAWLDPLATDDVLKTYKLLSDHGELTSEVDAFPPPSTPGIQRSEECPMGGRVRLPGHALCCSLWALVGRGAQNIERGLRRTAVWHRGVRGHPHGLARLYDVGGASTLP